MFHNGLAIIGDSRRDLLFIKKVMKSRLFWFYITKSSKHYGSEYFSLSKNYFKNFGVYNFSDNEKDYIIDEKEQEKINSLIELKYEITF